MINHAQLQNTKKSQTIINKTCKDAHKAPTFNIKISNIIPTSFHIIQSIGQKIVTITKNEAKYLNAVGNTQL